MRLKKLSPDAAGIEALNAAYTRLNRTRSRIDQRNIKPSAAVQAPSVIVLAGGWL